MDPQHPRQEPAQARGSRLTRFGTFALQGPLDADRSLSGGRHRPAREGPRTLAQGPALIDHASMAHLVHNLDNVAWALSPRCW